jgi:hypothetical protein
MNVKGINILKVGPKFEAPWTTEPVNSKGDTMLTVVVDHNCKRGHTMGQGDHYL